MLLTSELRRHLSLHEVQTSLRDADPSSLPPAVIKTWHVFASRLLTAREVAVRLRVSTRTVYALCERGQLAHVRIMNAIRVASAELAAFISTQGCAKEHR